MTPRAIPAALIALLGAAVMAAPSLAADATPGRLTVSPGRIELAPERVGDRVTTDIEVTVEGGSPSSVQVTLSDCVVDPDGGWSTAPAGSTPYSLAAASAFSPGSISDPGGTGARTYRISLSATATNDGVARAGIVTVALIPNGPAAGGGLTVRQAVAIQTAVLLLPPHRDSGGAVVPMANLDLAAAGLDITHPTAWTPIDALIPDLMPWLVDHGPMTAHTSIRNSGGTVLDARTETTFSALGPFDAFGDTAPGRLLLRHTAKPGFLLPGQVRGDDAPTEVALDQGGTVDVLPLIGILRVESRTSGSLGDSTTPTVVQWRTVLVFPWKETLAALVILGLWRFLTIRRSRARTRAADKEPAPG